MMVMMAMERTHLHGLRIRKKAGACQVRRDAGGGVVAWIMWVWSLGIGMTIDP
jgi:hypothetical protein